MATLILIEIKMSANIYICINTFQNKYLVHIQFTHKGGPKISISLKSATLFFLNMYL